MCKHVCVGLCGCACIECVRARVCSRASMCLCMHMCVCECVHKCVYVAGRTHESGGFLGCLSPSLFTAGAGLWEASLWGGAPCSVPGAAGSGPPEKGPEKPGKRGASVVSGRPTALCRAQRFSATAGRRRPTAPPGAASHPRGAHGRWSWRARGGQAAGQVGAGPPQVPGQAHRRTEEQTDLWTQGSADHGWKL